MVIACSADSNYALPLAVTLYSALVNMHQDTPVALYILDAGIRTDQRQRITQCITHARDGVNLTWVPVDVSQVQTYGSRNWMTGAAYARLYLPALLPDTVDKVIYLDADMIVREDVLDLWKLDIGHHAVAAVRDQAIGMVSSIWGIARYHERGLDPATPYFNSGVMVINLSKWRLINVMEGAFEYVQENKEVMRLNDQEALNATLYDDWLELDPRWNQHPRVFTYPNWAHSSHKEHYKAIIKRLIEDPYIIHFASKPKPWENGSMHPYQRLWLYYLRTSGWFTRSEWNQWWAHLLFETVLSGTKLFLYRARKVFPKKML